jgi:hypothetical protein
MRRRRGSRRTSRSAAASLLRALAGRRDPRLAAWTQAIHRERRPGDGGGERSPRWRSSAARCRFAPSVVAAASASRPRFRSIDEPGYWRHNQIAWAGVREAPPELDALVLDLRAALVDAKIAFDPKPFVAHLTLVRKARPGFRLPRLEPIEWPVRDFVLVRSVTGPDGSTYEVAERWARGV